MTPREEELLTSRETLRRDLLEDEEFRYAYAESFLNTWVAAQIKAIREQRGMTQADLAEAVGTKQAGISRLENVNYSGWKTDTLRRIARALNVRLKIIFEDFGSLLDEVEGFARDSLQRPKPSDDRSLNYPSRPVSDSRAYDVSFYRPESLPTVTKTYIEDQGPFGGNEIPELVGPKRDVLLDAWLYQVSNRQTSGRNYV